MKLRGITLDGNPLVFELKDGPIKINENITILCARPNSPIIQTKSLVRGLDDLNIFEMDYIFIDNKFYGFVIYTDMFCAYCYKTGEIIPLHKMDLSNIRFVTNSTSFHANELKSYRSVIRYTVDGYTFPLTRLVFVDKDGAYLYVNKNVSPIPIEDLKMCTGSLTNEDKLHFGQTVHDGTIVLNNYHPMVKRFNGQFREIEEEDYDGLGIA